uniref:Uncharacterized protein n=1 Tax=Arundo donax TaxID=35708 RepID=A0A0A9BU57_ARUDO
METQHLASLSHCMSEEFFQQQHGLRIQ